MGIQEKEIVERFREMLAERKGVHVSIDGIATLTAARVLKRAMEKCCIKICGAIEQSQPEPELKLTLGQAIAIIDMDNVAYGEGQGPRNDKGWEGWNELVDLAQTISGLVADRNCTPIKSPQQDFGNMAPPGGGGAV